MGDGGKSRTGKMKKRGRGDKAAAAQPSPADTAARPPPAPPPDPPADDEAAPVGFSARDTNADAKARSEAEAAAKKGGGAAAAVAVVAAIAVVAVAGYLTRAVWLPKVAGHKAAVVAGKTPATKTPAAKATDTARPPQSAAPTPGPTRAPTAAPMPAPDADALAKEREQLHAELDRLMARLDTVEKSMATARRMIRATAPPEEKVGGPSIEQLSRRIGELEKNESAIKDLAARVDKIEKSAESGGANSGAPAVVLAVSGLRDAIARGEPFAAHLQTLKAVGGDDPNIKATVALLAKGAAKGIPTLATLQERFDAVAGRIVQAAKMREDPGWLARAANRISSLITWRRVGDGAGDDSVDAIVARAERHLKVGDLVGAVKALGALESNRKAAAAAEPWLADAKARVVAERAVATLHVHALSLLTPAKP